jgi:exodeoxyribonuclease V gamma subunit
LRGAESVRRRPDRVIVRRPLVIEDEDPASVRLEDLVEFLNHPARRFIRARLGFRIPDLGEIDDDTVATRLGALEEWAVADRMLAGLLEGHDLEDLASRERGQDSVPPGNLGDPGLRSARERARNLWAAARRIGYDPARHAQFTGTVRTGPYRLEGSITADPDGSRIDVITPSRLKGKHRLGAFARLAFLTALEPSRPWEAVLIGRAATENIEWKVTVRKLGATPDRRAEEAARLLAGLVELYHEGLRYPIPLPVETAYIWQRKLGSGEGVAWREARKVWETNYFSPEGDDPAYRLLFPDLAGMEALAASPFPEYARRLWMPILPLLTERHA